MPLDRAQLFRLRAAAPLEYLSRRERQILSAISRGQPNKEIAEALALHPNTVGNTVTRLFRKLGVNSRCQAQLWARQHPEETARGIVLTRGLHDAACACDECRMISVIDLAA